MATIHHAVVKSAALKGVILTFDPGHEVVTALRPEPNRRVSLETADEMSGTDLTELARDAWNALDEVLAFEAEHPGVRIKQEDGDYVAFDATDADYPMRHTEIARDPDYTDLFESITEWLASGAGSEDADGDEDEPSEVHSVVPDKYKKLYRERGNPNHCGDWLAEQLARLCRVMDGKKETTDLDRLEAIANANGVAPERYGRLGIATNGWQGRFRMTVRNLLTPRVAEKGFLFVPEGCGVDADANLQAPEPWRLAHSPKAKPAKVPAPEAAVTKQPKATKADKKAREELGLKAANEAVKAAKAKKGA
jgi:hypothetical protein